MDLIFVFPAELHAFQARLTEFKSNNTAVIGYSIDSKFSHWAWLNTSNNKAGIKGVNYPLVADLSKIIAKNYDVLSR